MKPSNLTLLNALCLHEHFRRLGVPVTRIFVCSRNGAMFVVAIPCKGPQLSLEAGAWQGHNPRSEWASALEWFNKTAPEAELQALYDHWLAGKTRLFPILLTCAVQQRMWVQRPTESMVHP